jgi:hypothetical protein
MRSADQKASSPIRCCFAWHVLHFAADAVARDDSQVVDESGGGDKGVFDGHSSPGGAETCEQLHPPQTRLWLPWQTAEPLDAGV